LSRDNFAAELNAQTLYLPAQDRDALAQHRVLPLHKTRYRARFCEDVPTGEMGWVSSKWCADVLMCWCGDVVNGMSNESSSSRRRRKGTYHSCQNEGRSDHLMWLC